MSEACVILAAGEGSRYGGQNKALLKWESQTFLGHIVATCRALSIEEIVVVVAAPHREDTEREAKELGISSANNPDPTRGMASSVSVGFEYALREFRAESAWLWPVDSPAATPENLRKLQESSSAITIPVFQTRGGHPVRVARSVWPELADCLSAPEGARTILRRDLRRVTRIEVDDHRLCHDIDSPADWRLMQ